MRKLFLALASCAALVAFMGFSATASANHIVEADCDLEVGGDGPYNNDFAVHDFEITFPDSMVEHEVSGLIGRGVMCGSAVDSMLGPDWNFDNCGDPGSNPPVGVESFLNEVEVTVPPGVIMNAEGFGVPGAYLGDANANAISCTLREVLPNQAVTTTAKVNETNPADDCPDDPSVITCMLGNSALGYAYMWHTVTGQDSQGRDLYTLTIGPFHSLVGDAGLTKLNFFTFCAYAGVVGGNECGTADSNPDGWLQINGDAAAPDCNGGAGPEGIYTARAKNNLGDWTEGLDWCAAWTAASDPPETTITSGPRTYTASDSARFEFESSEVDSTFECTVDGQPLPCNENNEEGENGTTGSVSKTDLSGGGHHFEVAATDQAGDTDPTPAEHDWTVIDITITSAPDELSGSNSATFVFESSVEGAGFECKLFHNGIDYSRWEECNSGTITYPNLSDGFNAGQHTFQVRPSIDGNDSAQVMATHNWTVIDTLITSVPSTDSTDATFEFVSNVSGSKLQCKLDDGAWGACNGGTISYTDLNAGEEHNFSVRATGPGGDVPDETPSTHDWTIQSVTITDGPSSRTTSHTATFEFTSPVAGATFECKLDSGNWGVCSSPKAETGLSIGEHTFSVRRTGSVGADTKNWEVYTPNTTIRKKPSNTTLDATFKFASDAPDSKYQCKLDGGAWEACNGRTITYVDLSVDAGHRFEVRATGVDGDNTDQTPATHDWTIPSVNLSGPSPSSFGQTNSTDATFEFTSPVAGATFKCKLDSGNWSSCSSPKAYTGLSIGEHTFSVEADWSGGELNTTTFDRTWTINPEVTITNDPPGSTTFTDATFEFTSNVAGATFKCTLDGSAAEDCNSGSITYTDLSVDGEKHSFSVEAIGPGGSPTSTTGHSWFVLSEINTWISASPRTGTTSRDATFEYGGDVTNMQFECKLDGGAWEDAGGDCSSRTKTYTGLSTGEHTFSVRAIETGGGAPDSSPATYEWCINSSRANASRRGLSTCRPQILSRPLTLGL